MGLQNQGTTDAFVPRVSELLPHELGCMQTHIRRMIYPPKVIVNLIAGPSDYGKHVCARRRSWTSSVLQHAGSLCGSRLRSIYEASAQAQPYHFTRLLPHS